MSCDAKVPEPSVRDIDMVRVRYVDSEGLQHLVRLDEAADVPFENGRMVRAIPSHRDQGHMPGQYWVAKWGDFADYESVLEPKWLTLLDFDPQVTVFVMQPLEFDAIDARGVWQHTPDVFVRHRDGRVLLLDVKNPELRDDPEVLLQEERTRHTCARLGWDYAMVSEPSGQLYHLATGTLDRRTEGCNPGCPYDTTLLALGDAAPTVTGRHLAAERARAGRNIFRSGFARLAHRWRGPRS
ncbi:MULTISPECIES: TnsA-like heteromeric transposase endonuclease subunit [unclassified Streptomyces]|uniref:TnsA-like heteromeric transposase endonuclease subunit n=1 Tax=unclassified Streptomyces TaxID=2593676 RepID=UPI001F5B3D40|nr:MULTISPECIES: TnsA-like heteromeric transposase endonuclease subunit [unclassified Streptomyces]